MKLMINGENIKIKSIEDINERLNRCQITSIASPSCKIGSDERRAELLCHLFRNTPNLESVRIHGLDGINCKVPNLMSEILSSIKSGKLSTLDIESCFIPGRIKFVTDLLEKNKSLKFLSLDLGLFDVDYQEIVPLVAAIEQLPYLEELDMGSIDSAKLGLNLFKNLLKNKNLKKFVVHGYPPNSERDIQATEFVKALGSASGLEELNIWKHRFSSIDFDLMAESFKKIPHLTRLNLSETGINVEQIERIIRSLSNLEDLDISKNGIDSDGIAKVCSTLRNNEKLTWLKISGNRLDDSVTEPLMNLIKIGKLSYLFMNECNLGFSTTPELCTMLVEQKIEGLIAGYDKWLIENLIRKNKTLKIISIDFHVKIDADTIKDIADAIKKNDTLKRIMLNSRIEKGCDEAVDELCKVLKEKPKLKFDGCGKYGRKIEQVVAERDRMNRFVRQ